MKLTFLGAARMVTGSCYLLESGGKKLLVDCGLRQGRDEEDNSEGFSFSPGEIDAVIVTHAHIDHSGRLPELKKLGFAGKVYATRLTCQLLDIMLRDSAHIQESDAAWQNQKGKRAGRKPVEPLYTVADVEALRADFVPLEYQEKIELFDGITLRFFDAGHLLGSASVELWLTEDGQMRKLVFSGDIGNVNQPIVRDPQHVSEADFVVMESTYGDREHEPVESYTESLAAIMDETFARGGNVIIPSFAVGRTQELLYFIREIKERGLVRSNPGFPVYVDSPLANEATRIYSGDLHGFMDTHAENIVARGGAMFRFEGLKLSQTTDESKALNTDGTPKVIIAASGMCDAGRIRHHLKHNLWRPECAVVFVGYQANGSLGRLLLDGIQEVKLFGETVAVHARIVNFKGLSAHAGRSALIAWAQAFAPAPKEIFVTHGDEAVSVQFAATLQALGLRAHAPLLEESYDLLAQRSVAPGRVPEARRKASRVSAAFERLLALGKRLLEVIAHNEGGANRDLNQFGDEIQALIDKWDR